MFKVERNKNKETEVTMESKTIIKNGESPKSLTSRKNLLIILE